MLVRDVKKHRDVEIDLVALTPTDRADLINDPEIALIIEVTGASEPAFGFLRDALNAKKFVVTANKEVMAKHGGELLTPRARERRRPPVRSVASAAASRSSPR